MASERPPPEDIAQAIATLMLKLRARDEVGAEEEQVIRGALSEIRLVDAGRTVVRGGVQLDSSTLLIDGIIARYKDLADGQRQIMELHVSGDFVDLHSLLLKKLDHHVGALTPVRIGIFPHESLRRITASHPHLARLLWLSTLIDAAIHREKIVTIGRRNAIGRVAHILCELYVRLRVVGLADESGYRLPLTQVDIGDVTGLTSVHVNRMLKELRDGGILTFRGGEVNIHDWERLQRVAEFSPAYLHLDKQPR